MGDDEIAGKLAIVDRAKARGQSVADACRTAGIPVPTYYRWRRQAAAPRQKARGEGKIGDVTRESILKAAKAVFLSEGLGGSLNKVAIKAGVTRQTVYNLFDNRDRLFSEVVQSLYRTHAASILLVGASGDLVSVLEECGRYQLTTMLHPEVIGLMRVTLGEYQRHPELVDMAYAMRAGRGANSAVAVAQALKREMLNGTIDDVDPDLAAEHFIGSFMAHLRHRALIGLELPSPEALEERLQFSIRLFLKAIGYVKPPASD